MKNKRMIQQRRRPRHFAHLLLITTGGTQLLPQFAEAAYAPHATTNTPTTSPVIGFKASKKQNSTPYYTVQSGDTLERIAKRVEAKNLHRSQIIVALFRANPHAFNNNNLHKLKLGVKLHAPDYLSALRFSAKDAQAIIQAYAAPHKEKSKQWIKRVEATKNIAKVVKATKTTQPAKFSGTTAAAAVASKLSQQSTKLIVDDTALKQANQQIKALKEKLATIEKKLESYQQDASEQQESLNKALPPLEAEFQKRVKQLNQKLLREKEKYQRDANTLSQENQSLQTNREQLLNEKQHLTVSQTALTPKVQQAVFVTPRDYQDLIAQDNETFFRRTILKTRLQSPYSPLLAKAEALYCAATPEQAQPLLSSLLSDAEPGTTIPDEWLGSTNKPELYAGTLDILLATLERTSVRFPVLREDVERVALQWNYCDVMEGEQFYNIKMREERTERLLTDSLPLSGHGFRRWGFMLNDPVDRFIPRLISEIRLAPWAYQYFLHRAYRKQCFPHPVTGQRYPEEDREREATQRSVFQSILTEKRDSDYPYEWFPHCEVPKVIAPIKPAWSQGLLQRISTKTVRVNDDTKVIERHIAELETTSKQLKQQIADVTRTIEKKINQQQREKTEQVRIIETKLKSIMAKMEEKRQKAEQEKQRLQTQVATARQQQERIVQLVHQKRIDAEAQQRQLEKQRLAALRAEQAAEAERQRLAASRAEQTAEAERQRLAALRAEREAEAERQKQAQLAAEKAEAERQRLAKQRRNQPGANDIVYPVSRSGDTSIYWEDPKKPKKKTKDSGKGKDSYTLKLSGSISHNSSLATGNHTLAGSVNWSPYKNWFVNASGSYQYGPNNPNGFTYAWNAGYSDWRPGTMSFRLDNWGPLKPGDGLALDKAVFGASYKFDSDILRKYNLGGGLSYSYPLSGNSSGSLGMSMQYNLTKEWYFRTGVSQPIDGGEPTWTYGFGKYNWRPNKWRVEYSNYGKNEYPLANLNKGAISISRGWQKEWELPIPSVVRKAKLPSPAQQVADVVLAPPFAQPNKLPAPIQNLLEQGVDTLGSTLVKSANHIAKRTLGQDLAEGTFAQQATSVATQALSTATAIQKAPTQAVSAIAKSVQTLPTQAVTSTQAIAQTVKTTPTQIVSTPPTMQAATPGQTISQQATCFEPHAQLGTSPKRAAEQMTQAMQVQKPSSLKLTVPASFSLHHQQTTRAKDPRRLTF